jgi:hypothetical protein
METFRKLFGSLLLFVYHCFDRIVGQGYLPLLTRPEHIGHFFRDVHGIYPITKEALAKRTQEYQQWVEAYARNHRIPIEWPDAEPLKTKKLKKEDYVRPYGARMQRQRRFGVYFIFKSLEQGPKFGVRVPKYPTDDPHYRIVSRQRSRYTHYYFYITDEVLGPLGLCVGSFLPFRNVVFRRHFPIHKIFERSAEIGVFRLTADVVAQIFGVRKHKRLRGKLHTMLEKVDPGHDIDDARPGRQLQQVPEPPGLPPHLIRGGQQPPALGVAALEVVAGPIGCVTWFSQSPTEPAEQNGTNGTEPPAPPAPSEPIEPVRPRT